MAGRDIRRLVAHASLQSGPEKALVAKRMMAGMAAVPNTEVLLPDDQAGFFAWLKEETQNTLSVRLVDRPLGEDDSTVLWVRMLVEAGAGALVVVGGDGTQRNVAQAAPPVPVLPVAGGTNNVACYLGDQTAGGYAVARYLADGLDPNEVGTRAKLIHVGLPGGREELALIDAALTRQNYTGAMAIWDANDVSSLILTVADAVRPGLSNVGGFRYPLRPEDPGGLFLRMSPGSPEVPAVLAPGLMGGFPVAEVRRLDFDEALVLASPETGATLSLDGERTVVLRAQERAQAYIRRDGPFVLDPGRILFPHRA
ncbi:ATP-NAD kinase [Sulfobacillus sp. DSM 109850]|uniref:ATP-NAD kinase n=2 Tax=Sulfobacillus harzensis TaxID=2729629 RepID=A0A7Y0Q1D2_9FIRM|nr:NAD(+)/NADH kinase [Sulfobacillus harzensis]NMP21332.1 ATP-NAD kinase [Sulfobacillus harzensis]